MTDLIEEANRNFFYGVLIWQENLRKLLKKSRKSKLKTALEQLNKELIEIINDY